MNDSDHTPQGEERPMDEATQSGEDTLNHQGPQPSEPAKSPNSEMLTSPITELFQSAPTIEDYDKRTLALMNGSMEEMEEQIEKYPQMDTAKDIFVPAWLRGFQEALEHLPKGNTLSNAAKRDEAHWRQKVDFNGQEYGVTKPGYAKSSGQTSTVAGERAIMELTDSIGLGTMVQVPLWHTGIWVTLKPPTEGNLLELERRIAMEKIHLGRYSSGMIFSATSVYSAKAVVDFVLDHVHDATVKNTEPNALKSIIKVTDMNTLIWGLACAVYPEGYDYARPCTVDPTECQHVVHGKLSLPKLFWVDRDSLSDWQKRHMSYRSHKSTTEELETYQKEHERGAPQTVKLLDNIEVELAVPSLLLYEQTGRAWVDGIVEDVEQALGSRLQGDERNRYLIEQGRSSQLCQYAHWVNAIYFNDKQITDRETIDASLGRLSSHEKVVNVFFEKVGQYIDDSTLAFIAMIKYDCPACGQTQQDDMFNNRHPQLLPIDVLRVFFTQLGHLLQTTQDRTTKHF